MLRILTAGESHGPFLLGIIEGFPANVPLCPTLVNADLARRQRGYGRGGRMQIESDQVEFLSGLRGGKTLGSPIGLLIKNKDHENWVEYMDPLKIPAEGREIHTPRPGHADLVGGGKYGFSDLRNVLERSSARETAIRVACGSIMKQFLALFAIELFSHVVAIEKVRIKETSEKKEDLLRAEASVVRCICPHTEKKMIAAIDKAKAEGDSVGGVLEVQVHNLFPGLGSYVHWDRKLDARLSYQLMSIPSAKGVEFGLGFSGSHVLGSEFQDAIYYSSEKGYYRNTNRAGGIEGGMSNGEILQVRLAIKPIPTLKKPLQTVDIHTKKEQKAAKERADTCAVPSASVIAECLVATVLAEEILLFFGGNHLKELLKRWRDLKSH